MINFKDGIKQEPEDLINKINKKREFVYIFKDREKTINYNIKGLKKIYSDNFFSGDYKTIQIQRMEDISESLKNTFDVGKISLIELEKIGNLGIQWSNLENIVKNYQCDSLTEKINSYVETFNNYWWKSIDITNDPDTRYFYKLKDIISLNENFKNVETSIRGEKLNKFIHNFENYTNELGILIETFENFEEIANDIENKLNHNKFKKDLLISKNNLKDNSNRLLNKRLEYLYEISPEFEKKFINILEESKRNIEEEKIIKTFQNSDIDKERFKKIRSASKYSNRKQEYLDLLEKCINNIKKEGVFSAKKQLDNLLKINNRNFESNFYLGLYHLRKAINVENIYLGNLRKHYDSHLEKAINNFKLAENFSVGETKINQIKNHNMTKYANFLQIFRNGKFKQKSKKILESIVQKEGKTKNITSKVIKTNILFNLSGYEYFSPKKYISFEDLNSINKDKILSTDLKEIDTPEKFVIKGSAIILEDFTLDELSQFLNKQQFTPIEDVITYEFKTLCFEALRDKKKKIKKQLRRGINVAYKKLKRYENNEDDLTFLLRRKNYDTIFYLYLDRIGKIKKKRYKKIVEQL